LNEKDSSQNFNAFKKIFNALKNEAFNGKNLKLKIILISELENLLTKVYLRS
jgi:hypothetical protein